MSYCEACDRWFPHAGALSQHMRDSAVDHPTCDSCDLPFGSFKALRQHINECHYYCHDCGEMFSDEEDYVEHGLDYHYTCTTCAKTFTTFGAIANHYDAKHYYCRDCNRSFQSEANLIAHRGSSLHTPRSFKCPGRSCNRAFVSASALIHHAESGACPSGVTRRIINAYLARIDTQNTITNPARMISGGTDPEYWATERSWNGDGYACVLCNDEFRTLSSLNQHLKSPRHLQPFYHCPKRTCNVQFTVLSALCQHVERGSCGARETRLVQDVVGHLRRGMRSITL